MQAKHLLTNANTATTRRRIGFAAYLGLAATAFALTASHAFARGCESIKVGKSSTGGIFTTNRVVYGHSKIVGSGVMREESRAVSGVSRLTLTIPAIVKITQGATESLSITADDNLLPLMLTRVVNGELIIEADKNTGFSTKKDITVQLAVKSLDNIQVLGSGDVVGESLTVDKFAMDVVGSGDIVFNALRTADLRIGVKGSGDVKVKSLTAKSLESQVNGSGDIHLCDVTTSNANFDVLGSGDIYADGKATSVAASVSGSGDIDVERLTAREAKVKVNASGDVRVHASESLDATVNGSGDVRYGGSPKNVSRRVNGSGTIKPQ